MWCGAQELTELELIMAWRKNQKRLQLAIGAALAIAAPVGVQDTVAQTNPTPPSTLEENAPKKPVPGADIKPDPNKSTSEQLKDSEGVIKPPPEVDPHISKPPPKDEGNKMPVIIPPGEPGGDPTIQPK
jgi:hypothetical protein